MDDPSHTILQGLTLPSPAYIAGAILFGVIGIAAYRYGRKREMPLLRWAGVALMVFPYLVSETWALYCVGAGICALMVRYRDWGRE